MWAGLLAERGIALCDLLGRLVDQPADAQRTVLLHQPDTDVKFTVRLASGAGQIPPSLLRIPFSRRHLPAADRAKVLLPAHRAERGGLVSVAVEHGPLHAAGQLSAVEAVFVRLHGSLIRGDALRETQLLADERRMIRVAQRVVRGTGGRDVHHLHGRRQRLLRAGAVGLRIEDQLRVVPARRPSALQTEHREIFPQDRDIVKAPRQKHAVLAAPRGKLRGGLREAHALFAQQTVADTGQRGNLAVHFLKIFGSDEDLELVRDLLLLRHAHSADLHDLAAHRRRQRLFRAV